MNSIVDIGQMLCCVLKIGLLVVDGAKRAYIKDHSVFDWPISNFESHSHSDRSYYEEMFSVCWKKDQDVPGSLSVPELAASIYLIKSKILAGT